jgi:hypothetical protein
MSRPRTGDRRGVLWTVIALATLIVVVSGGIVWKISTRQTLNGGAPDTADDARATTAAPPAGLAACGKLLCPGAPMCWAGLTSHNGATETPRRTLCTEAHRWETFAVLPYTVEVPLDHEDGLKDDPAFDAACSASLMLSRRRDSTVTTTWERQPWLIQLDGAGPRLVHCLAQPGEGETETGETATGAF